MAHWMIWSILAAAVVILELFSGTFYLLMIAVGLAGGALVSAAGGELALQIIVAAVVGLLATSVLRTSGRLARRGNASNPDIHLDIGQLVQIDHWQTQNVNGAPTTSRAMYRGAMWDIELAGDAISGQAPVPGRFTIREIRGSRLIVEAPTILRSDE